MVPFCVQGHDVVLSLPHEVLVPGDVVEVAGLEGLYEGGPVPGPVEVVPAPGEDKVQLASEAVAEEDVLNGAAEGVFTSKQSSTWQKPTHNGCIYLDAVLWVLMNPIFVLGLHCCCCFSSFGTMTMASADVVVVVREDVMPPP